MTDTTERTKTIDELAKLAWRQAMHEDAGLVETLQAIRVIAVASAARIDRWKRYAEALEWLDDCGTTPERHDAMAEVDAAQQDLEAHGDR